MSKFSSHSVHLHLVFSFFLFVLAHPRTLQCCVVCVVPSLLVELLSKDDLVLAVSDGAGHGVHLEVVDHLLPLPLLAGPEGLPVVEAVEAEVGGAAGVPGNTGGSEVDRVSMATLPE